MTLGNRTAALAVVGAGLAFLFWWRHDVLKNPAGFVAFPLAGYVVTLLVGMGIDYVTQGWFEATHVLPWGVVGAVAGGVVTGAVSGSGAATTSPWAFAAAGGAVGVFAGFRRDLRQGLFAPWGDRRGTREHFGGREALRVERYFDRLVQIAGEAGETWPALGGAGGPAGPAAADLERLVLIAGAVLAEHYANNELEPGRRAEVVSQLQRRLQEVRPEAERHRSELNAYLWSHLASAPPGEAHLYGRWIFEQMDAAADTRGSDALSDRLAQAAEACLDNPLDR